ncbi:MAG TPA: aldo/keto reductase [Streptosporangiaceae bacterium]|nr:aldo/keto reductase [Streptosporangiaceae bacterium]
MTQPAAVPSLTLSDGVAMPLLGFGTWQLRARTGREALCAALSVGYRHIDTATMYGNEADVGHALASSGLDRREVFITTKLPATRAGHERATLAASLRALGTSHVDLWLVHSPPPSGRLAAVWREFLALQDEGRVRSVGVSNYSLAQIDRITEATGQPPTVNQIPWSPRRHDPGLLAGHRERGVAVEGYSPLLGTDLADPVLAEVGAAHGVTTAQVVLRWHLEHGIVVIPRSAHPERIAANADLFAFSLTPEEVARIDGLARR